MVRAGNRGSDGRVSPGEVIIDNDDPGTSYSGAEWGYSSGVDPYDGSSRAESMAGATYTFQGSVSGYQGVSLWWTYWSSRCERGTRGHIRWRLIAGYGRGESA